MTMDRLAAYRGYLERHPPVHLLAAWYLDYKPPGRPAPRGGGVPEFATLPDVEE